MMRYVNGTLFWLLIFMLPSAAFSQTRQIQLRAENELPIGRLNQTMEITTQQLAALGEKDMNAIHIKTDAGRELVSQVVYDKDGDKNLIFQADFAPSETRIFYAFSGNPHFYDAAVYKTYGRFVRERLDDFAWENDRIAMRAYGPALKVAEVGGLASSAIDIWCKKTGRLVINDWYMKDHYHSDTGDGADLYQSGTTRGVGGDGVWSNNRLWTADNFVNSRVLSSGPLRISFSLSHDAFSVGDSRIDETRYITLDAGQNLNHFSIKYRTALPSGFLAAAGIQNSDLTDTEIRQGLDPDNKFQPKERKPGKITRRDINQELGWVTTEQSLSEGNLFGAMIVNPKDFQRVTDAGNNLLVLARVTGSEFSYWAGFAWSESGQFNNYDDWKKYIDEFARSLSSSVKVTVGE